MALSPFPSSYKIAIYLALDHHAVNLFYYNLMMTMTNERSVFSNLLSCLVHKTQLNPGPREDLRMKFILLSF